MSCIGQKGKMFITYIHEKREIIDSYERCKIPWGDPYDPI